MQSGGGDGQRPKALLHPDSQVAARHPALAAASTFLLDTLLPHTNPILHDDSFLDFLMRSEEKNQRWTLAAKNGESEILETIHRFIFPSDRKISKESVQTRLVFTAAKAYKFDSSALGLAVVGFIASGLNDTGRQALVVKTLLVCHRREVEIVLSCFGEEKARRAELLGSIIAHVRRACDRLRRAGLLAGTIFDGCTQFRTITGDGKGIVYVFPNCVFLSMELYVFLVNIFQTKLESTRVVLETRHRADFETQPT